MSKFLLLLNSCLLIFTSSLAQENKWDLQETKDDPYKELKLKLESTKVTLDFQNAQLMEVFQFIRDVSACNIVVDSAVESIETQDVCLNVTDLPVQNCINLLCSMYKLRAVFTNGVLLIAPENKIKEKVYLKVYDTRDLVFQIKDFPGIRLAIGEKKEGAVGVTALFSTEPEKTAFNDADKLLELLKETVDNDWEQEGQSIAVHGNKVLATTSKSVHRQLEYLINELRANK
ncbi:MAG: hypothetical protein AABZ60_11710 [Planctomycetota bacterium]|mgnify:CR=1 FL=1